MRWGIPRGSVCVFYDGVWEGWRDGEVVLVRWDLVLLSSIVGLSGERWTCSCSKSKAKTRPILDSTPLSLLCRRVRSTPHLQRPHARHTTCQHPTPYTQCSPSHLHPAGQAGGKRARCRRDDGPAVGEVEPSRVRGKRNVCCWRRRKGVRRAGVNRSVRGGQ